MRRMARESCANGLRFLIQPSGVDSMAFYPCVIRSLSAAVKSLAPSHIGNVTISTDAAVSADRCDAILSYIDVMAEPATASSPCAAASQDHRHNLPAENWAARIGAEVLGNRPLAPLSRQLPDAHVL